MPRAWVVALIVICTALNGAGFLWHLFEPIPLYDEIAHLLTPLVLVAITAEIIYRSGGDDEFFDTPRHAIVTGSAIGLVGAAGWEGIEVVLDMMGFPISRPSRHHLRRLPWRGRRRHRRVDRRPVSRPAFRALSHGLQPPPGPLTDTSENCLTTHSGEDLAARGSGQVSAPLLLVVARASGGSPHLPLYRLDVSAPCIRRVVGPLDADPERAGQG